MSIFSVLRKFDPEDDAVDRRILHEITGFKLSKDKFWDTSDEDEDELKLKDTDVFDISIDEDPNRHLLKKKDKRYN